MSKPWIAKPIDLRKTCIWAAVLIAVDAFVLNQGVISFLVGAWMLLVATPRAIFYTKDPALRRQHLARAGILFTAAALVIGLNKANNQVAQSRAETLIAAVKAFHRQNHRYPEKLEELVPGFIDRVPRAKYTYSSSFQYRSWPNSHTLIYAYLPPFGRRVYYFEHDEWGYMD
jgi:hypothetical protein